MVVVDDSVGMGFGVVVVVVDSKDKYTKRGERQHITSAFKMKVIKYTQAVGLRLRLLTAVLPDTVHSVMVKFSPSK